MTNHLRRRAPHIRRRAAGLAAALTIGLVLTVSGSAPSTTAYAACSISTSLAVGSTGSGVQCVQQTLAAAGHDPGPIDGSFGSMTRNAVAAYQRAEGLFVDGIVGPRTGGRLGVWGRTTTPVAAPAPRPVAPAPSASAGGCTIAVTLRQGSSGAAVRCLQARLNTLGYSAGPADGGFGPMTRAAVVRFQQAKRLLADGVVGPRTGAALGIWGSGGGGGNASCTPPAGTPAGAQQVVVVDSSGSRASVDLLVKSNGTWTCARTDMAGRVGRDGVRPILDRRSGDGTTPGGIFGIGSMTAPDGQTFQFFGNGSNPGVRGTWRQVKAGDCWGATPGTADYNRLANRPAARCTGDDEYLPNYTGAYSQAALIGANMGPNRSGDQAGEPPLAAAIFLHRHSYDTAGNTKGTAGCVSLSAGDLAFVLARIVPNRSVFVIR